MDPMAATAALRKTAQNLIDLGTPSKKVTELLQKVARNIRMNPDLARTEIGKLMTGFAEPLRTSTGSSPPGARGAVNEHRATNETGTVRHGRTENLETLGRLASEISPEPVIWLIKGLIPCGKLTLIAGDPGKGKTLLAGEIAARVSRGKPWLDGTLCEQGTVVMLSGEDGAADTLVPRLRAADADLSKIRVCGGEELLDLPDEIQRLEDAVEAEHVRLIVLDPLNSFLDARLNPHQDASVRRALAPLAGMAQRTGAAIVVIFHLNKDGGVAGKQALYRPTGSIGFVAAARASFLLAPNPKNENERVLAPLKFNLDEAPPSWAFEIRSHQISIDSPNPEAGHLNNDHLNRLINTARIEWTGKSSLTANELVSHQRALHEEDGKLGKAVDFLLARLTDGPKCHRSISEGARANGISDRTLRRAKDNMGIVAFQSEQKTGTRGSPGWLWRLP